MLAGVAREGKGAQESAAQVQALAARHLQSEASAGAISDCWKHMAAPAASILPFDQFGAPQHSDANRGGVRRLSTSISYDTDAAAYQT